MKTTRRTFLRSLVATAALAPLAAVGIEPRDRFNLAEGAAADAKKLAALCGVPHMPTPVWEIAASVVLVAKSRFLPFYTSQDFVYYSDLAAMISKNTRIGALHAVRAYRLNDLKRWVFIARGALSVPTRWVATYDLGKRDSKSVSAVWHAWRTSLRSVHG